VRSLSSRCDDVGGAVLLAERLARQERPAEVFADGANQRSPCRSDRDRDLQGYDATRPMSTGFLVELREVRSE
jgi:hypothetical protein